MTKVVAIVQARMGASRLPNKMMLSLHGYPIVEWVYRRVLASNNIDTVVFALPNNRHDDVLALYLETIGARVFRGSETDVVERFYNVANYMDATEVVRICADNPLISSYAIDLLVDFFRTEKCDYAYNHIPKGNNWPDGLGAEICNITLLRDIYKKSKLPSHREHLFNYVIENSGRYKISTINAPKELAFPELKLDLDTLDDYKKLLSRPYRIDMGAEEIVKASINIK